GQDRVFAADLLVAFEFQIDEKVFRTATDLDPVLVRGENRFPLVLAGKGDGEERRARADDGSVGVLRNRLRHFGRRRRRERRGRRRRLLSGGDLSLGRIFVPDGLDAHLALVERAVDAEREGDLVGLEKTVADQFAGALGQAVPQAFLQPFAFAPLP